MEPTIYFMKESPDFDLFIEKGRMERISANRVVICVMTEFGLYNDRRMGVDEFGRFIESIQTATGTLNEKKEDIRKNHYKKKKSVIATIEPVCLSTLAESTIGDAHVGSVG